MSEISTISGLSLNPIQNHQQKLRYEKHVRQIVNIAQKRSNIKEISTEQERISEMLRKSKQMSKSFKVRQFELKREEENKRLMKSISMINNRAHLGTSQTSPRSSLRKKKGHITKQDVMKKFEVERGNAKLAQNLIGQACDADKYKKKMEKEINQYIKIKTHLQRLKPIPGGRQKGFVHQESHQSMKETFNLAKMRLKTLNPEQKGQESSQSTKSLEKLKKNEKKVERN